MTAPVHRIGDESPHCGSMKEAARLWALMRVHLAEGGRRVGINDVDRCIAAKKRLPVVTQDDDFKALEGIADLTIICV